MILVMQTCDAFLRIKLYKNNDVVGELNNERGREMSLNIFNDLETLVTQAGVRLEDLTSIVVFQGPGSFTSLRIGITVCNTLAYGLSIPIVGETGDDWVMRGLTRLEHNDNDRIVLPVYGGEANITTPRK
jgi:tRNA threonylcarbamoyladenosine biosynthesis protein TsaB